MQDLNEKTVQKQKMGEKNKSTHVKGALKKS